MNIRIERYQHDSVQQVTGFEGFIEPEGTDPGWIVYFRPDGSADVYAREPGGAIVGQPMSLPARAVEGTRQHDFAVALEAMRRGHRVTRLSSESCEFVVLMPALKLPPHSSQEPGARVNDRTARHIGEDTPLDSQPYFASFEAATGRWKPGWSPSAEDLLATDWVTLDDDPPPSFPPPPEK